MRLTLCNPVRLLTTVLLTFSLSAFAKNDVDSEAVKQAQMMKVLDSIDASIPYKTGKITLNTAVDLDVPAGYKFVPADKSQMILHDLWNNPERKDVLGMIVKSDYSVSKFDAWVFVLTYNEDGYVKDEDADKIDYDDLLKKMQESEVEENKERTKEGYDAVHLLAWASKPYYDKENKILHWAKKIQFGEDNTNLTLNYDVRILGRKGVLSMNAVGTMEQLQDINSQIPAVVKIAKFTDGNKYSDFNPSMDKVAAYTIGGLIAGKLIAKAGIFVLLLKYIKIILLAIFGGFAALRKKIGGWFSRKKDEPETYAYAAPVDAVAEPTATEETPALPAADDHANEPPAAAENNETRTE